MGAEENLVSSVQDGQIPDTRDKTVLLHLQRGPLCDIKPMPVSCTHIYGLKIIYFLDTVTRHRILRSSRQKQGHNFDFVPILFSRALINQVGCNRIITQMRRQIKEKESGSC